MNLKLLFAWVFLFAGMLAIQASSDTNAATIVVNTVVDENDGVPNLTCSIREAAATITGSADYGGCVSTGVFGADSITIPAGNYSTTSTIQFAASAVLNTLDIQGDPLGGTVIAAGGLFDVLQFTTQSTTISAQYLTVQGGDIGVLVQSRDFYSINSFSNITIKNNRLGLYRNVGSFANTGTVTINDSLIENNLGRGGVYNFECLELPPSLFINNSVIRNNSFVNPGFENTGTGGLYSCGHVVMKNTQVTGNTGYNTGGITIEGSTTQDEFENVTIANNIALSGGVASGIAILTQKTLLTISVASNSLLRNVTIANNTGAPGFVNNSSNTVIYNTLVSGNSSGECVFGATPLSILGSGSSSSSCLGFQNTSLVANLASALSNNGSIRASIGAVTSLGIKSQSLTLLTGSQAIDTADNTNCAPDDQAGFGRPFGIGCDVGSFEYRLTISPPAVVPPVVTPPTVIPALAKTGISTQTSYIIILTTIGFVIIANLARKNLQRQTVIVTRKVQL
jgi:hypothetical protein